MNNEQYTTEEIVNFILNKKGSDLAKLSLENISETFAIHKNELDSLTLTDSETSIHKFLNRQKAFMAMEIMEKNPKIEICEIATLCGFSDFESFRIEFTDYFLIDPQKYRVLKEYAPIIKKMNSDL